MAKNDKHFASIYINVNAFTPDGAAKPEFWNITSTGYPTDDGPDEEEYGDSDEERTKDAAVENAKSLAEYYLSISVTDRVVILLEGTEVETKHASDVKRPVHPKQTDNLEGGDTYRSKCQQGRVTYNPHISRQRPWAVFVRGTHICCVYSLAEGKDKLKEYDCEVE